MHLYHAGRNWDQHVNWDDLGKLCAGFIISWTVILSAGIVWLVAHRRVPSIKIRNVGLSVASVACLHIYLIKICLAYVVNGHFTCWAEFWIMSIYLPFGIALFQANTVQLESISRKQQALLQRGSSLLEHSEESSTDRTKQNGGLWSRWRNLTAAQRTHVFIGVGMLIQFLITGILYATSPALQGDWKAYGHISHAKGQAKCRRSLQWIASAFWQLFWTWIFGPYLLYKIRNINDAHCWRFQVICTVVSGMPGVPLWLAAVYAPPAIMHPLNMWWVPPMWLAPGIIVMQAVTIFIPIYEAIKDKRQLRKTLGILQTWEASRKNDEFQSISNNTSLTRTTTREKSMSTTTTSCDALSTRASTHTESAHRNTEMYTMAALEKALAADPHPLLQFAATQDFTAENIVFLMHVRQWHTEWDRINSSSSSDPKINEADQKRLFYIALEIYMTSVCESTAEFPINIEGAVRKPFDDLFGSFVEKSRTGSTNNLNPFDAVRVVPMTSLKSVQHMMHGKTSSDSESSLWDVSPPESPKNAAFESSVTEKMPAAGGVTRNVFDSAEESIKYLVLTNTWQKLVEAHNPPEVV